MPVFDIAAYRDPLDLLDTIIREKKADIYDLPIAEITGQYLEILDASRENGYNMELASSFILMAATLLQIKSQMLLPSTPETTSELMPDPRDELVFQLMAYRRTRLLSGEIERRFERFSYPALKEAETVASLGLAEEGCSPSLEREKLFEAAESLAARNRERYGTQHPKIRPLLKRERFSVRESMHKILRWLHEGGQFFFHERFSDSVNEAEKIAGFLAMLQLLHEWKIRAEQKKSFSTILIQSNVEGSTEKNGDKL